VLPGTQPRPQAEVPRGDFLISRAKTAERAARAVLVPAEPRQLMTSDKIERSAAEPPARPDQNFTGSGEMAPPRRAILEIGANRRALDVEGRALVPRHPSAAG